MRRPVLALPLVLLCAPSCSRPSAPPPRPNVLLVVIDTLRADRLPFYGCERDSAPFLGELAKQSRVFESAWSAAPWTVPAMASLMTSVYPFQHGLVDGFDIWAPEEELAESPVNKLPGELETVPELFKSRGYRTFGVSANVMVGFELGFDGGFDRFVSLRDMDAATVNATLSGWREEILDPGATEPWFVYLHYFDPHDNYNQREPWFDVEGLEAPDLDSASRFARFRAEIRLEEKEDPEYAEELARMSEHFIERAEGEKPPEEAPSAAIDRMLAAYDSEIRYLDEYLRELFAQLDPNGNAAVIVTADHGEEFLDHGEFGHGQSLYNELVRVPLLLHLPGPDHPTGRVSAHVSTMDVLPTCRELLGAPPSPRDQGRSLLGARRADRTVCSARLNWSAPASEDDADGAAPEEEFAVVSGRDKLVFSDAGNRSVYRLFDLAEDPGERTSHAGTRAARVLELRAELDRLARELPRWERTFGSWLIDDAIRAHMRGTGYAGDGDGGG